MILIVTYDLRSPKDYHNLYEVVKVQGNWWHYMASTWLLSTNKEPQQVVEAMLPYMDTQDLLFVCELTPKYQGRLPKPAWDWINAELKPKPLPRWPYDPDVGNMAPLSNLDGGTNPFVAPPTMPDTKKNLNAWIAPSTVPGSEKKK